MFIVSIVDGETYTDLGQPLLHDRQARAAARAASTAGLVVAVLETPTTVTGDHVEIARYEDGAELIGSEETEVVDVHVRSPGAA